MSDIKPIILYSHAAGPNPWKVVMIMNELGIPYEAKYLDATTIKAEPFLSVNPNGRVPAIEDPNTDIKLWESGAIIEYLVDKYDMEGKLGDRSGPEKYLLSQWLHFQTSGQGPYFGQYMWFSYLHHENLPSAKERYLEQILRVFSVLDKALEGKQYLLGDKCTYADIAFVPWNSGAKKVLGDDYNSKHEVDAKYPNFAAWHARLEERPSVKEANRVKESLPQH